MRCIIRGNFRDAEVIAEEFVIDGVDHRFVVHNAIGTDPKSVFSATHLETGFLIGWGDTIDEAIAHGTRRWTEASPEKLEKSLDFARAKAAEREAESKG